MTEIISNKSEQTHQQILHAAYDLFTQQGYHGTSMRQIAKRAGVALGGIYNHFSGKEEIFRAVFMEFHPYHDVVPALQAASGEDIDTFIRDAIHQVVNALNKRAGFLQLMLIEVVEFNGVHIGELFELIYPEGVKLATALMQSNLTIRPISPLIFVRVTIGFVLSYYITGLIMSSRFPDALSMNTLDNFIDIYLHGIVAPEARHESK
jgi:AcrR family transcriptional regulator